jgi:hypothetical protein
LIKEDDIVIREAVALEGRERRTNKEGRAASLRDL